MNTLKMTAAAAALMALPFAASAAPVVVGPNAISLSPDSYSFSETSEASNTGVTFQFTITEDLRIPTFNLSSSAPSGGSTTTLFSITDPGTGPSPFTTANFPQGGLALNVAGSDYAAGDTFEVIFTETSPQPISYTVSFTTAEVPVPAAGLLLLTALGGAAAMRRRKKA